MSVKEITLKPGWLLRDVTRAQARLAKWQARFEELNKETPVIETTGVSFQEGREV